MSKSINLFYPPLWFTYYFVIKKVIYLLSSLWFTYYYYFVIKSTKQKVIYSLSSLLLKLSIGRLWTG